MSSTRTKELVKMLRSYGFTNFRTVPGSSHLTADHPHLDRPMQFAFSPSGGGYVRDLELRVRRRLGLSGRGRVAVEGERQKPRKRQVPQ